MRAPSEVKNSSDVIVDWQQRSIPLRFNLSVDDSGNDSTGKYLGTVGVAWDNPLYLNDILSVSYTKNLSSGKELIAPNGSRDGGSTYNYSINYSVPWDYWALNMGVNHYNYSQVISGLNRNYHYRGNSDQANISLSKVLYRDSQHKLAVNTGLWFKENKNYIDDAEVSVQHRRSGGWLANVSLHSYYQRGTLMSSVGYKRGTRAFRGISAPEELFNEGSAKMKVWTADINWFMPFLLSEQKFNLDSRLHIQWNQDLLTPQDRLSIGGRYNVRGFNGSKSLSAERGGYVRNDILWNYLPQHQLYLGLDIGYVSGKSANELSGKGLAGATLGLKGNHRYGGDWSYDTFVSTPLKEPSSFNSDKWVSGFSINYSF